MRPACILLIVAAVLLFAPQADARSHGAAPTPPQPTKINGATKITVANADDTLNHWSTCVEPRCHPGGKGTPVSTNQTINNPDPSTDGASMLITETVDSKTFSTNVLWPYKLRGCDDCTQMSTDFQAYPVSASHLATLEYDAFLFDGKRQLDLMWGMQWNQSRRRWQVWNQGTGHWIDTSVTTGPTFGDWNHIQTAGHRVIGDTGCNGTECLYYDSLTLNGTTYTLNMTEPAGPIHPGWHSASGFQFQLDATAVKDGTAVLSEYIDQAGMLAN